MATTTVEGRRQVLEAATKRLAAAKTQKASACENLQSAQAMEASAKDMMEAATKNTEAATKAMRAADKELGEAKAFLSNAKASWKVIDIDDESEANESQSVVVDGSDPDSSDESEGGDAESGQKDSFAEGRPKSSDEHDGSDDEDKNISDVSFEETSTNRKRKRGPSSNGQPQEDFLFYPELPRWPPVSRRKMLRIGPAILKRLRELDTLYLFSRPVLEDFPNITDEYLNAIETPMDFRTIEEERLPEYKHIVEMQEDLERTFKNCCRYNGEKHECSVHALKLWRGLNDIFEDIC